MYPDTINANGNLYKINTDFRVALSCFRAIDDDSIKDETRALAVITLLLGKDVRPADYEECLKKCAIYLRCGKKENLDVDEIDMDYLQDARYIRTSIRQCYPSIGNVDEIKYLHWWEYNELIEGLTEDTILNRVRELRNFDLKDETDPKKRKLIKKAKDDVALVKKEKSTKYFTKEENDNMEMFEMLMGSQEGGK